MPSINKPDNTGIISRNDFLFTVGAIAVIAGLLFPASAHILDVLLIFSISLTASVLMITFSAKSASQVLGFPLVIVLTTMLHMALSIASARITISHGDAGIIISFIIATFR